MHVPFYHTFFFAPCIKRNRSSSGGFHSGGGGGGGGGVPFPERASELSWSLPPSLLPYFLSLFDHRVRIQVWSKKIDGQQTAFEGRWPLYQ
jgi:hypothetical protein